MLVGVGIRAALLPVSGFRDDIDQFAAWVHGIAVDGLSKAYDQALTFGPVMAYIWGILAAVEPAFRTATDASDPAIRALMRVPAASADIGLALVAAYALRDRPRWAIVAAAVIVLHPAVIDVSIWFGQYESIYVLSALAAVVLAINGHDRPAAALVAVSLMTKPQALPFILPFAAWFWARGGIRGLATAAAIGGAVIVVLWLPFIPADGPSNYLKNLAFYQQEVFPVLSLRAWNLWWIVQERLAGGDFVNDQETLLGPLTGRALGYGLTAGLSAMVALSIVHHPRPRTLVIALTAATLVAFCFLTAIHERYSFAALILPLLLLPDPRFRWFSVALGILVTANLLAAIPPTPEIGAVLPVGGILGLIGSVAMLALTAVAIMWLPRSSDRAPSTDPDSAMAAKPVGL